MCIASSGPATPSTLLNQTKTAQQRHQLPLCTKIRAVSEATELLPRLESIVCKRREHFASTGVDELEICP